MIFLFPVTITFKPVEKIITQPYISFQNKMYQMILETIEGASVPI